MITKVGGRKVVLVGIGLIGVFVYGILKDVDPQTILDLVVYLIGIGVGGIALEDGLGKLRSTTITEPPKPIKK